MLGRKIINILKFVISTIWGVFSVGCTEPTNIFPPDLYLYAPNSCFEVSFCEKNNIIEDTIYVDSADNSYAFPMIDYGLSMKNFSNHQEWGYVSIKRLYGKGKYYITPFCNIKVNNQVEKIHYFPYEENINIHSISQIFVALSEQTVFCLVYDDELTHIVPMFCRWGEIYQMPKEDIDIIIDDRN